jgi:putative SOS response-associated peptidase YedK
MCYNVQQKATLKELTERFNANFELPQLYIPQNSISGFSFPQLPVITADKSDSFQFFNWGLVPHWSENKDIRKHTLNARLETIEEKPSFRSITQNRCILPITGFYEWKWLDSKGKRKEKYFIKGTENISALAGLYDVWEDKQSNEIVRSFTLLTTKANELMAEIHNTKQRMPLLLSPNGESTWLKNGELELEEEMKAEVVSSDGQLGLF